jgi:FAD/FMN-containing dehydrogenase
MVSRRRFLGGIAGAVAIAGFDPVARTWVSTAHADHRDPFDRVPRLDGEIIRTPEALAAFSTDAGNMVHRTPVAILRPGSSEDIARMIRFCRRHHIYVAARGQGHTTFGQSLAEGGLMVDMSTLDAIHSIDECEVDVDAGATWRDVVAATIPLGLTPPVLTGYINLSIGGTLAVGGISTGFDRGAQVDHVLELEVVTGEGEIVRCSERRRPELFLGCLAGLGQCGIVTRAIMEVVPALPRARNFILPYFDNATFFADMRTLLDRNEFDNVFTIWVPDGAGGWLYLLNATKYYDPPTPPDDAHLLRDLRFFPPASAINDTTYHEFVLSIDVAIDFLKSIGMWDGVLHPWFDVWLPGSTVEEYIGEVIPSLTPADVGATGFMLMFPHRRSNFTRPLLRVPSGEWVFLFDILTANSAPGPDPAFRDAMLARNRRLFERARELGGTRYPIGSLDFDRRDWMRHYGPLYFPFRLVQHRYDPDGLLAPGVGL